MYTTFAVKSFIAIEPCPNDCPSTACAPKSILVGKAIDGAPAGVSAGLNRQSLITTLCSIPKIMTAARKVCTRICEAQSLIW
jgi:hypothetical protein